MRRADGSRMSYNQPAYGLRAADNIDIDTRLFRCMVTEVFFIDDPQNRTFQNKQVTYECVILGGSMEGQLLTNVKAANQLGGQYNYEEKIYRKISVPLKGNLNTKNLAELDGDIVYVQTVQGSLANPVIIGCGTQPLDLEKTGATSSDGPRFIQEYNGIRREINKDGEYIMDRKGGFQDPDLETFVPEEGTPEMKYEVLKNEVVRYTMKSGLIVLIDGANDKVTITTPGGANFIVDGSADKIQVQGSIVELGKAIQDLAALGNEVRAAFNEHTHQYFDQDTGVGAVGSAVRESNPPSAPMTVDVLSTVVNLE